MYTFTNFKSKKALKEAVIARNAYLAANTVTQSSPMTIGAVLASKVPVAPAVRIYQPNEMFPNPQASPTYTGHAAVEGPHYPKAHSWYASVELVNGEVVKVK